MGPEMTLEESMGSECALTFLSELLVADRSTVLADFVCNRSDNQLMTARLSQPAPGSWIRCPGT